MMPFVMFVSGVIIASVVAVTGAAMVLVWTVAYGSGRYCRRVLRQNQVAADATNSTGRVIRLSREGVS
ncbi:MAG: hypothetical protein M1294_16870 [Firmicutes bacterium]|jgi:hypothetical protein|uniref:Uncharacterized protein n=1 Tax=Sulfobacillus benefaciens TaxID=453960 RepID=A0A2T2WT28_9FIRM|nr:hypothetical protein [Bacillota bacterium]MCL5012474.1 hypothetical protein [Bacillota bacterium]PSR25352.1 MAG: hypothetical protein C7B43_17015 [Sulfobacillus benefaciens]